MYFLSYDLSTFEMLFLQMSGMKERFPQSRVVRQEGNLSRSKMNLVQMEQEKGLLQDRYLEGTQTKQTHLLHVFVCLLDRSPDCLKEHDELVIGS